MHRPPFDLKGFISKLCRWGVVRNLSSEAGTGKLWHLKLQWPLPKSKWTLTILVYLSLWAVLCRNWGFKTTSLLQLDLGGPWPKLNPTHIGSSMELRLPRWSQKVSPNKSETWPHVTTPHLSSCVMNEPPRNQLRSGSMGSRQSLHLRPMDFQPTEQEVAGKLVH